MRADPLTPFIDPPPNLLKIIYTYQKKKQRKTYTFLYLFKILLKKSQKKFPKFPHKSLTTKY